MIASNYMHMMRLDDFFQLVSRDYKNFPNYYTLITCTNPCSVNLGNLSRYIHLVVP